MKNFNKTNIEFFRFIVENTLKELGEKNDISFKVGSIRYSSDKVSFSVEAFAGDLDDAREINWNKYCYRYGLLPEHFGKPFISNGSHYIIWDIKSKNKKYPILAKEVLTDKIYKFPIEALRNVTIIEEIS